MAKRTNSGTTKATGETKAAATKETKARRAPARRRADTTTDAPIATASDLAQPGRTKTLAVQASDAVYSPSAEDVSRRAYEIYCGRGGTHGSDVEDWLEAERQLRSQAR
jgi:hypothetical protein